MRYPWLCAILCAFGPGEAAAQELTATVGANYSRGRYGGPDQVEIGSTYLGLSATISGWRLDTTLPYLIVRNQGSAVDAGGIVVPGSGGEQVSGVGDLNARLSRDVSLGGPFSMAFGAEVKLPTGSAAVSTGQLDAQGDIELSRSFDRVTPFVSAGYRTYGDSAFLDLEDGWTLSAGSYWTRGTTTLITSYEWSESAVGGAASQELLAVGAGSFARRFGWTIYGSRGLSSNAADLTIGAGVTVNFGSRPMSPLRRLPRS